MQTEGYLHEMVQSSGGSKGSFVFVLRGQGNLPIPLGEIGGGQELGTP